MIHLVYGVALGCLLSLLLFAVPGVDREVRTEAADAARRCQRLAEEVNRQAAEVDALIDEAVRVRLNLEYQIQTKGSTSAWIRDRSRGDRK